MGGRTLLTEFSLRDPVYAGAVVSIFVVDPQTDLPSSTLARLYSDRVGPALLPNPQRLDIGGRWLQPVYVEERIVLVAAPALIERGSANVLATFLPDESFVLDVPGRDTLDVNRLG